jgi:hypothetical protein
MAAAPLAENRSARTFEFDLFGMIRRRVLVSIGATVGWLSLTLLFLAFWSHGFSLFQDVIVVIVSILILTGVLLGAWVSFGLAFADRGPRWD